MRQNKQQYVGVDDKISYCNTLKGIKERVEELIKKYGEEAQYDFDVDNNYITECLYIMRPETDEEMHRRVEQEAYRSIIKRNKIVKNMNV